MNFRTYFLDSRQNYSSYKLLHDRSVYLIRICNSEGKDAAEITLILLAAYVSKKKNEIREKFKISKEHSWRDCYTEEVMKTCKQNK